VRQSDRPHDKLLFGSDCPDSDGTAPKCTGAKTIAAGRRFAPSKKIERKVFYENTKKLLRL
jgi:predicted TIM-barrel fold metal-dependent hydrolase